MKITMFIFSLISLLVGSCATINFGEINNLVKVQFDSIMLRPDRETSNLRIDVMRLTYSETVDESTTETKEMPYNPLGFNLGNGLFYDLNKNLSFRLDYLLGFRSENKFEIQEIFRPEKSKRIVIYTFKNDTLFLSYPTKKKTHYYHHRIINSDTASYMYKNRMMYALIENDTSVSYSDKGRNWNTYIHKLDKDHYYLKKGKKEENYQISGNSIFLDKDFIVSLINNNTTIEIKMLTKRKSPVLWTIEKSSDEIFVYSIYKKKYYSKKLECDKNSIDLYLNNKILIKYELKN
jgi:hypothetical protein